MATEPPGKIPEEVEDQAIMEKEEEVEEKTKRGDVEKARDNAKSEKDGQTSSSAAGGHQEVKEERAVSITISSHLSYRERTASNASGAATTTAAPTTDATTSATTHTDATATDTTSTAATTTDATATTSSHTFRDRNTSTPTNDTASTTISPAHPTSSQQAFKGRVTSNTHLLGSAASGHPSKATDLSSDSSTQVKDGHEGGKESCNIMGGDWRKVISQRRGATCSVELISKLKPSEMSLERRRVERDFCTGSIFVGQVDAVGMEGECAYTMPHEVIFEGAMHDGRFEGPGTLAYPNKGRVDGTFTHGKLAPSTYTFPDGLVYELSHWTYCSSETPDRRFQQEIKYGLKPVCTSLKTQLQPTRPIPEGCYDTGDGFYNPKTRCVTSAMTGNIIRIPTKSEANWIAKNCRKAWDEPSGFRPVLNENFQHDDVNYGPLLIAQGRRKAEQNDKMTSSHA